MNSFAATKEKDITPKEKEVTVTLSKKEEGKKRLEKLKTEEMRIVKGRFLFHECPGGSIQVVCKKFKDHLFDKVMIDNEEYEIPLYVARWLNGIDRSAEDLNGIINSCSYPVHAYAQTPQGIPRIDVGQWRRRMSFQLTDVGI